MNFSYIYFLEIVVSRADRSILSSKATLNSVAFGVTLAELWQDGLSEERLVALGVERLEDLAEWHDSLLSQSQLRNKLLEGQLRDGLLLELLESQSNLLLLTNLRELLELRELRNLLEDLLEGLEDLLLLSELRELLEELSNDSVLLLLEEQWDQLLEDLDLGNTLLSDHSLLAEELWELLVEQIVVEVANAADWVTADELGDGLVVELGDWVS